MTHSSPRTARAPADLLDRVPPASFFLTSAVFHYLGPSFAVLLFARVDALGVAWLRIASAAVVFAAWRRPWRVIRRSSPSQRRVLLGLGVVLAAMNSLFYLAIDRLPLSTVGAVEFLGTIVLAAAGVRSPRNLGALLLAGAGVTILTDVRLASEPLGFVFAFANCGLFMLYVMLGHRIANTQILDAEGSAAVTVRPPAGVGGTTGSDGRAGADRVDAGPVDAGRIDGIDRLGAAMLIAAVVALPAVPKAAPAFTHPGWLLWGIGVGLCSSVIPYVTDQLAMARLPRATFALMLALLPATATVIGLLVLSEVPTGRDLFGIALVIAGVALHRTR